MPGDMVVASALGAAMLYAVAAVLQQRAASTAPVERSLRLGLLAYLISRPLWLLGAAADVTAFGLQFWALDHGSLVLVQPLLVSGLLFALPLGAVLSRSRLRPADWLGSALVVTGLSVFLVVANPDRGRADASTGAWLLLGAATAVPVALCVWAAGRAPGPRRAAFLSAAAGIVYGVTAAITKSAAHLLDLGFTHAALSWKPYVGICLGIGGMVMDQSAYQAGPLASSLPALTVADPVVSIIIGAVLFEEGVEIAHGAPMVEAMALIVMVVGVFVLARSPLVISLDESEA